jgi:TM2 domain-containing membrane protein YozV
VRAIIPVVTTPGSDGAEQHHYKPTPWPQGPGQQMPPPPQLAHLPAQAAQPYAPYAYHTVKPHSPALAVVASFFFPGLGSMLNDKVGNGVAILLAYLVSCLLALVLIGFILAPAAWIWGMVACGVDANRWNRAHGIRS